MIKELGLHGNERILDLACGYGRHALEFARRGYFVVGVDITKEYIDDARATAEKENLLLTNYPDATDTNILRPYEARMYLAQEPASMA